MAGVLLFLLAEPAHGTAMGTGAGGLEAGAGPDFSMEELKAIYFIGWGEERLASDRTPDLTPREVDLE